MDLNNKCCNTETLDKVTTLFQDNDEKYTLYKCPTCQTHWLYKKVEENWVNNHLLQENEHEAWYIRIEEKQLEEVMKLKFSVLQFNGNYVYINISNHKAKLEDKDKVV
jgi:hypothetical protein